MLHVYHADCGKADPHMVSACPSRLLVTGTGANASACALQASVAEAGFMTGLERNSDAAQLAAFAPLLTNYNASLEADTCPTSMIIFDNHRWLAILM